MSTPAEPSKSPPANTSRVQVELPASIEPIYANFALITHSPSEIIMDFAQLMPQLPQARVRARLVMTPLNAKLLLRALNEHLARFEQQYGEIIIPEGSSLADKLFRGASSDSPGEA
jgi:hypothetical protein